jgi:phosphatidate cytidylyltransferase
MLKARVLTAALLIPLVVSAVLYLSTLAFIGFSGLLILLAVWEWSRLAGFKTVLSRTLASISMPCLTVLVLSLLPLDNHFLIGGLATAGVLLFWSFAGVAVWFYPKGAKLFSSPFVNLIMGLCVLIPFWVVLVCLKARAPEWLLYILILVCSADIGAYFVGKRWGKHRLAPDVSPGKSWEGVMGALFCTQLVSIGYYFLLSSTAPLLPWLLLNAITVIYSIVGDLFESLFKRQQNLKDSGAILPGHGGILDRIDSLTAAFPIFSLGYVFFCR